MSRAVNIGWLQPPSFVLSNRRSMRRLRLFSCRRILAFTRNPSWLRSPRKQSIFLDSENTEGFRVFQETSPPTSGEFAWLGPRRRGRVRSQGRKDQELWRAWRRRTALQELCGRGEKPQARRRAGQRSGRTSRQRVLPPRQYLLPAGDPEAADHKEPVCHVPGGQRVLRARWPASQE